MLARVSGIDVIVADAETGDDFELGEMRQRRLVGMHGVVGDRHAAGLRQHIRRQPLKVGLVLGHMQDELVRKAVFKNWPDWSVDQEVDLFGRDTSGHQFSFPSALSCQRRNKRWVISASSP